MKLTPAALLARPATLAATPVRSWAVESQQRARRNAMLAANACAARRAQREEIEDYLARLARHHPGATAPAHRSTGA